MTRKKKWLVNSALFFISIIISLVAVELVFRAMIFSPNKRFEMFRDPGDYADFLSEDLYWKLYHHWDGKYKPPDCVHPELGWIGNFSRSSLVHFDLESYSGKRPVLLYGDSYAACSKPAAVCFEEILNKDDEFSKSNHLYNYGTGGYGLDQIYLLFKKTWKHYEKPFVVFSLFIHDLDRTTLSVRTGQKPYFKVEGDSLKLLGVPLEKKPDDFFKQHPPSAFSYLFRKYLFSDQNILGANTTRWLLGQQNVDDEKIKVNRKILRSVVDDLSENNTDFVFLVFHILRYDQDNFGPESELDWRSVLLKDFFRENDVPYIWSKDLILEDTTFESYEIHQYMLPGDGHPTTHLNKLIAGKIKEQVLYSESDIQDRIETDLDRIARIESDTNLFINTNDKVHSFFDYNLPFYKNYLFYIEKEVRNNPGYMETLNKKAIEKNLTVDETIRRFAMWLIFDWEKECR